MRHLVSFLLTGVIYGGALIASRWLLGMANPRQDWATFRSWWHWSALPFLPTVGSRLWVYAFALSGASLLRLEALRASIAAGGYADDMGL